MSCVCVSNEGIVTYSKKVNCLESCFTGINGNVNFKKIAKKQDFSPRICRHNGTPHFSHPKDVSNVRRSLRFLPAFEHMAQAFFVPCSFSRKWPAKFSSQVKVWMARLPELEGHLYPL